MLVDLPAGTTGKLGVETAKARAYTLYSESPTARTVSGSSGLITLPDDCSELIAGVNVTVVSGTTPTLIVRLRFKDANGVWQQVKATSTLTATGPAVFSYQEFIPGGGDAEVAWIIGGTTPSFTFQTSLQGR